MTKHNNEDVINFIESIVNKKLDSYSKDVIETINELNDKEIVFARGNTRHSIADLYLLYTVAISVMDKKESE